jgi:hypothetical protein
MTHLGDTVSAYVDGALDDETAWRVSAHVAQCRTCRSEIEAERALKMQLAANRLATVAPGLPAALAASLLGIATTAGPVTYGLPAAPVPASRRPAARVAQAAPRGRVDVGGPGRSARSGLYGGRAGGRYVAAAGLAASVMVGLGGGALGGGAGTLAGGPSGAAASTPAVGTGGPLGQTQATTVPASLSSLLPVAGRSIVRPSTRAALSVVYRRP